MKKLSVHVLLLALLLSAASIRCSSGSNLLKTGSSLMSALGKVPNLSQFTNLLQTPGLDKLLGGVMKKPFSLLAPTNDALGGLASGAMGDVSKVADMVKNLIVPGKKDAASPVHQPALEQDPGGFCLHQSADGVAGKPVESAGGR